MSTGLQFAAMASLTMRLALPKSLAAQEDGVPEFVGCKKVRVFRFAIQAQSVRDTEITIGWNFVHELLTIGTPFQHGAVSGVAKFGRTILSKPANLPSC